ncbi:hypothetical protein CF319_g9347, partial [Tilletia indica]
PFCLDRPIKSPTETYEQAFANMTFSPESLRVMENWAALRECEDARDADLLLRRKRESLRSEQHDQTSAQLGQGADELEGADADIDMEALLRTKNKTSAETLKFASALAASGWFEIASRATANRLSHNVSCPAFSVGQRRKWSKETNEWEAQYKAEQAAPQASTGVLARDLGFADEPRQAETSLDATMSTATIPALPTERRFWTETNEDELINDLASERLLTPSQTLAFRIAARHFFKDLRGIPQQPLRLLMHGEAGTGKTVVVRLLRELLERFGKGTEIIFMAPTGKAACAIGGMTQHAAFRLEIHRSKTTSDELTADQSAMSVGRRISYLQEKFSKIKWLFLDEVSMTSAEMMGQMDQALRVGRQNPDVPFGGMNMMFAGDLCQLPPVGSTALYAFAPRQHGTSERRSLAHLGRAIWMQVDEVVEFTEQKRMQDADMAAALSRLRVRKCTQADVDLFNTNVLTGGDGQNKPDLSSKAGSIVLARTNETVRALNHQKATRHGCSSSNGLAISHAKDSSSTPMTDSQRAALLSYNGPARTKAGLGRIPLFIGMPIVYRGSNLSVPLGITNGAFGSVAGFDLAT